MNIDENIYRTNGFRILGLDITAKHRRIDNRIARVDRFMERNSFNDNEPLKDVFDKTQNDFLLPVKPEPSYNEYQDAKNRLYDVETRLVDEIFWFWPKTFDSKLDEEVIEYLKDNNYNKAISYWGDVSDTNTMNMTSVHNLAVLYHVRALDGFLEGKGNKNLFSDLETSLNYWSQIVNSNNFKDFVKERVNDIRDPRLNEQFVDQVFDDLPYNLLNINYKLLRKTLSSGKLSKRKQDYVYKYINSIENSPFDKSIIKSFSSKITKAIEDSIKGYKEPFEENWESLSDNDAKFDSIFEYSENVLPYLSILKTSFKDNVISDKLLNETCRFIYNKIPTNETLIFLRLIDTPRFDKFMELLESLKEYATDSSLIGKLDDQLVLKELGGDDPPQSGTSSEPTISEPSITPTPPEEYSVSVNVRDDDGDGLSNVDVTLTNMETDRRYFGETNSFGSCRINNLPSARYSYKAAKMGYDSTSGTIRVDEDCDLRIRLEKDKPATPPKPPEPPSPPEIHGGSGELSYGRKFFIVVATLLFIIVGIYAALSILKLI